MQFSLENIRFANAIVSILCFNINSYITVRLYTQEYKIIFMET